MAVSLSSKFTVAAGSPPQVVGDFNKFDMHATPKFPCGYKVETANGDIYRYGHFGEDTAVGLVVAADISESSLADTADEIIAPADCVTTTDGTIGSYFIEADLASVTASQYAGAKLLILDDTGAGYTYDIVDNTATDNPATGNIRIQLAQPLAVALDATTDIGIRGNRYANLESADPNDIDLAGVSCAAMDVSEAAWGWLQTKGVVTILADGTIDDGDIITLSDGVAGAVQTIGGGGTDAADLVSEPIIGFCVETGVSGEYSGHIINLE